VEYLFPTLSVIVLNTLNGVAADSNVNVEAYYGHSENKCNLILKFVHPSKTAEVRGELERSNNRDLVSFDLVNLICLSKRTEWLGKKGFTVHGNTNVPVLYLASQERC
jgi:hypothetical protein